MKVLHFVPSFYPATVYGGPLKTVRSLCRGVAAEGCDLRVLTTDCNGPNRISVDSSRDLDLDGYRIRYCARTAGDSISLQLARLLPSYVAWADVVHVTAVYNFGVIPALLTAKLAGKRVVWSPRGALQRWEGTTKRGLKRAYEAVCAQAIPRGSYFHVTSDDEKTESMAAVPGLHAFVSSNGVEIPEDPRPVELGETFRLLFVGRIHPKKGIENLLRACGRLPADFAWSLDIVGGGDAAYVSGLKTLAESLALRGDVRWAGHKDDDDLNAAYLAANLLVVPSFTENFGQVIGEALAHRLPVIASTGTPWSRLVEKDCGYWVDNSPETLAATIQRARTAPLREMGRRGRAWMIEEYSWRARAKQLIEIYRETMTTGGA